MLRTQQSSDVVVLAILRFFWYLGILDDLQSYSSRCCLELIFVGQRHKSQFYRLYMTKTVEQMSDKLFNARIQLNRLLMKGKEKNAKNYFVVLYHIIYMKNKLTLINFINFWALAIFSW